MKDIKNYINESTASTKKLSEFSSKYNVNALSQLMNNQLGGAKVTLDVNIGNYTTTLNTINNYKYNPSSKNNYMFIGTIIEHAILSWLEDNKNVTPRFNQNLTTIDADEFYSLCDGILPGNQDVEIKAYSPLAIKEMKNIQKIDKKEKTKQKLFILHSAEKSQDKKSFNIIGKINDKNFDYDRVDDLTIMSSDKSTEKKVDCSIEKKEENINYLVNQIMILKVI